jgi:hypothetical protein
LLSQGKAIADAQPKKVEEKKVEEKPTQMAQVSSEQETLASELGQGDNITTDELEKQAAQLVQ